MKAAGILLCAGSSSRMGENKLMMSIGGKTVMRHSFLAMISSGLSPVVIAVSDTTVREARRLKDGSPIPVLIVSGGKTRTESVYNALKAAMGSDVAVIHDAARCLAKPELIKRCAESAAEFGSGIAALAARDTVRKKDGTGTLDRDALLLMQTPQAFLYDRITAAYEKAKRLGTDATDDCSLYEGAGYSAHYVTGDIMNQKLTVPGDLPFFESMLNMPRTGYGEDTHLLTEGRRLVLGGVDIPHETGLLGHSDADVLTHAVIDALLGAASLGDIGRLYPDTDEKYLGISSLLLLEDTGKRVVSRGFEIGNIDMTVVAQAPKLAPYIENMRKNIAGALGIDTERVSVKATTTEGTGPEGRKECMTARGVCTLVRTHAGIVSGLSPIG
jgi:2-C-methyl-D-erythritol 2,4-cyclodiphosphate synthase/2-C-methyl-D-erythritol 4-phosphate cytidylyltransferase